MSKAPSTNATRLLKQAGIPFTEHLYLNSGSREFLVGLDPKDLERVLKLNRVSVAIP